MPITNVAGVVTFIPIMPSPEEQSTGVYRAADFAVRDNHDYFKQISLDPSLLTSGSSASLQAPAGAGGTWVLPAVAGNLAADGLQSLQYNAPISAATVVAAASNLVLKPAATIAALTITFPASPLNGQVFSYMSTQIITTLTLGAGTGTIVGGDAAATANGFAKFIYRTADTSWYRIG